MDDKCSCPVCGNEFADPGTKCPYCGAGLPERLHARNILLYRSVDLEKGRPTVESAVNRFRQELLSASRQGCRVLVLIHGYGSSGRGGAIKEEILNQLELLKEKGQINDFLPGDECDGRFGHGRELLRRFPLLAKFLKRPNPGRSLVVV